MQIRVYARKRMITILVFVQLYEASNGMLGNPAEPS